MITQMTYKKITPDGVLISQQDEERLISAETVIVAAGATSNDSLFHALQGRLSVHVIGGAREAGELDAKRAILDGSTVGRII